MALFDKVKAQAAQVAHLAQEAGKAGQTKIAEVQTHRQADALLHDLGLAVFTAQSGRGDAGTDAEIQRLVDSLTELEREHGPLTADDDAPSGGDATDTSTSVPVHDSAAASTVPDADGAPTSTIPVANTVPTATPSDAPDSAAGESPPPGPTQLPV